MAENGNGRRLSVDSRISIGSIINGAMIIIGGIAVLVTMQNNLEFLKDRFADFTKEVRRELRDTRGRVDELAEQVAEQRGRMARPWQGE